MAYDLIHCKWRITSYRVYDLFHIWLRFKCNFGTSQMYILSLTTYKIKAHIIGTIGKCNPGFRAQARLSNHQRLYRPNQPELLNEVWFFENGG